MTKLELMAEIGAAEDRRDKAAWALRKAQKAREAPDVLDALARKLALFELAVQAAVANEMHARARRREYFRTKHAADWHTRRDLPDYDGQDAADGFLTGITRSLDRMEKRRG